MHTLMWHNNYVSLITNRLDKKSILGKKQNWVLYCWAWKLPFQLFGRRTVHFVAMVTSVCNEHIILYIRSYTWYNTVSTLDSLATPSFINPWSFFSWQQNFWRLMFEAFTSRQNFIVVQIESTCNWQFQCNLTLYNTVPNLNLEGERINCW